MKKLLFTLLLLPFSVYSQVNKENTNVGLCDKYQEVYTFEEISECRTISVKGKEAQVASYVTSITINGNLMEKKMLGNRISGEIIALLGKSKKQVNKVSLEKITLTDGSSAGFRILKINKAVKDEE